MANPDVIQIYYPELSEISSEAVAGVRGRLQTYLQAGWPDLDMSPNSVFGDLMLTPFAFMVAATEEAMGRFMSDLDLENVANGIIWNCDFIRKYLNNFAIVERDTLQSSGVVRLTFNKDLEVDVDRRMRFQFESENDLFDLRLAHPGNLLIKPVAATLPSGVNAYNLTDIGDGLYSVDVPITGVMETQVDAGDTASVDLTLADLVTATALYKFDFGAPPETLSKLAEKTRETYYAATLNTAGGARRFLTKEFPDLVGISPVVSGDTEMVRDMVNPLGFRDGRMDIMVRSSGYTFTETQVLRLTYDDSNKRFVGRLTLTSRPYKIDSIIHQQDTGVSLTTSTRIYSQSSDSAKAPLLVAAYSEYEVLTIIIDMPEAANGDDLLRTFLADDSTLYADFNVAYRADPMLPIVGATLGSREVTAQNVDVLSKGFVPLVFDRFDIQYIRKPGTVLKLDTARAEILAYVNGLSHPDLYSDAKIYDAMFYAGAMDIRAIDCRGKVQWTVANRLLDSTDPDPLVNPVTAEAAAITMPDVQLISTAALKPAYVDLLLGLSTQTLATVGVRNIQYILDSSVLEFSEVQE